ncbi:MAG TPA: oxidoreductase [Acidimicrobiia bacterium]
MTKPRFASVWLGGCSGCHMSFLDMDEWLFDLAELVDVVYSPIIDVKAFPENVDITLVEGAVANEDNVEVARVVRANSRVVASFGDCAVSTNVTGMRNPLGDPRRILERVYLDSPDRDPVVPEAEGIVPALLEKVLPLHKVIPVDFYMPGCPPSAAEIRRALETLLSDDLRHGIPEDIRRG